MSGQLREIYWALIVNNILLGAIFGAFVSYTWWRRSRDGRD